MQAPTEADDSRQCAFIVKEGILPRSQLLRTGSVQGWASRWDINPIIILLERVYGVQTNEGVQRQSFSEEADLYGFESAEPCSTKQGQSRARLKDLHQAWKYTHSEWALITIYYTLYCGVNFFPSCEMGQLPIPQYLYNLNAFAERGEAFLQS